MHGKRSRSHTCVLLNIVRRCLLSQAFGDAAISLRATLSIRSSLIAKLYGAPCIFILVWLRHRPILLRMIHVRLPRGFPSQVIIPCIIRDQCNMQTEYFSFPFEGCCPAFPAILKDEKLKSGNRFCTRSYQECHLNRACVSVVLNTPKADSHP